MLNEIYLDRACCDELDISYSDPKQGDVVVLKPSVALLLRPDWDKHHRSTFHEFIFADRDMRLQPSFVKYEGSEFHRPGWYTILNPPNTRHFVNVDVDTEILRKQRNLLLEISDELRTENEKLLSGVITLLDEMLDQAEAQSYK